MSATDVIILVLSAAAIDKEGFLKREIRWALDLAEEKHEFVPFLVPVRIEAVQVPQALSAHSWLDTAALDFDEKLIQALSARAALLGRSRPNCRTEPWSMSPEQIGPLRGRTNENIVAEADLPEVVALARRLHPRHQQFAHLQTIFGNWLHLNPRSFEFITTIISGWPRRIGYTCVLPLPRVTYHKYASGKISEWALGLPANPIVRRLGERPCKYLLIQSIELEFEYRKKFLGDSAWFHTLMRHLAQYNSSPLQSGAELIADGNKIGEYLLTKAGFRRIATPESGGTVDPRPLFQLRFKERNPTASEKNTINVLDRYMRAYGSSSRSTAPPPTI